MALGGALVLCVVVLLSCTVEQRNKMGRSMINYTGADGVCDIYAGDKLVMRFIKIDKLTTGSPTSGDNGARAYRYGYGVLDKNFNYKKDEDEKQLYFEISDFSTNYVFYENPE